MAVFNGAVRVGLSEKVKNRRSKPTSVQGQRNNQGKGLKLPHLRNNEAYEGEEGKG